MVVFSAGDPVGTGLVDSLARPGGHLTGISDVAVELAPKRLQLLKEMAPGLRRVAMLWNAGLGAYHAGVEWQWWEGPKECAGAVSNFGPAGSLIDTIQRTRVIRCDEAAWRFLGLSLAGYNVLISLALAGIAVWGALGAYREWKLAGE